MSQGLGAGTILSSSFSIADGANLDAFSRLRVSDPYTLFDVQCTYDADPIKMETGNSGTGSAGAHNADTRMVALTCTAGTGTSWIQSYAYHPYQPGKSQAIFLTGLLDTGVAGVTVDAGLFDSANGIFLRQNGASGLQFVRRTTTSGATVDTAVDKADWNIDKLDGSGASGITIDETKVFILVIDLQFLGMGRVRCGFDIDGKITYCHEFKNANVLTVPYMQQPALPVGMLVTASSSGASKTAYFKCASVLSEGAQEDTGYPFATPEVTVTAASGARTALLALRPRTTFNSKVNRSHIMVDTIELIVTGSTPILWELCTGVAYSVNPTYANVNATYSACEYGGGGTYSSLGGYVMQAGYVAATATVKQSVSAAVGHQVPIALNRAASQIALNTLSLLVTGIGGTSATRAVMNFKEVR